MVVGDSQGVFPFSEGEYKIKSTGKQLDKHTSIDRIARRRFNIRRARRQVLSPRWCWLHNLQKARNENFIER